ncbi:hypothetical protein CYMTET_47069, partial [Cymbomonas tetramitiformis]
MDEPWLHELLSYFDDDDSPPLSSSICLEWPPDLPLSPEIGLKRKATSRFDLNSESPANTSPCRDFDKKKPRVTRFECERSAVLGYDEERIAFFEEHLRTCDSVVTEDQLQWRVGDNVIESAYDLEMELGFRTVDGQRAPCLNGQNRFKYVSKKDYTQRELCVLHEKSADCAAWAFAYRHRSLYAYNEKCNRWFEPGSLIALSTRGNPAVACGITRDAVKGLGLSVVEKVVIFADAFLLPYIGEVKTKPSITSSYQVKITEEPPRYLDASEHGNLARFINTAETEEEANCKFYAELVGAVWTVNVYATKTIDASVEPVELLA